MAVHQVHDPELIKQYGVVELDEDDRIVGLEEKPAEPRSDLAATAAYLLPPEDAALVPTYLAEGNPPDAPGNFLVWLHTREPVYGYRFEGGWMDIGNPQQLLEADNLMRQRLRLPPRDRYVPE
jgi:glucose-1-phosphate thymidylyltransferase